MSVLGLPPRGVLLAWDARAVEASLGCQDGGCIAGCKLSNRLQRVILLFEATGRGTVRDQVVSTNCATTERYHPCSRDPQQGTLGPFFRSLNPLSNWLNPLTAITTPPPPIKGIIWGYIGV